MLARYGQRKEPDAEQVAGKLEGVEHDLDRLDGVLAGNAAEVANGTAELAEPVHMLHQPQL